MVTRMPCPVCLRPPSRSRPPMYWLGAWMWNSMIRRSRMERWLYSRFCMSKLTCTGSSSLSLASASGMVPVCVASSQLFLILFPPMDPWLGSVMMVVNLVLISSFYWYQEPGTGTFFTVLIKRVWPATDYILLWWDCWEETSMQYRIAGYCITNLFFHSVHA